MQEIAQMWILYTFHVLSVCRPVGVSKNNDWRNFVPDFRDFAKGGGFAERYYLEILSGDWWSMFTRIRRKECVSQSTRIGQRLSFRHRQWRVKGMKGRLNRVYIRRNHEMMIIIRTLCKTSLPWLTAMNADSVRIIDDMLIDINDDEIVKDVTWQTIRYTLQ